ncbi:Two-component response regulator SSK1p [Sporothrix curviconia]|uniref:Two-component response regulator SSK1p n=1 Tax=Sporothrix curviconia TaxID=1260050 RepID=A0ABP0BQJ1_9PEZI
MSAAVQRKVWVRRPGASATLVAFNETDVVDDVREMLLRKYGNSLGRMYDAPDVTLRLTPRETHQGERTLAPDELMTRTLDVYYPGGQTIEEALMIDVPTMRRGTPNASPRGGPPHAYHLASVHRDGSALSGLSGHRGVAGDYSSHSNMAPDYFGPGVVPDYYNHGALTAESEYSNATLGPESMAAGRAAAAQHLYPPSPGHHHKSHGASGGIVRSPTGVIGGSSSTQSVAGGGGGGGGSAGNSPLNHPHSISIIATGQAPPLPNLPSPGGSSRRSHKDRSDRPKLGRQISTADDGSGVSQINGSAGGAGQKGQGTSNVNISIAAPNAGKMGSRSGSAMDGISQKSKGSGSNDAGVDKDGAASGSNNAGSARSSVSSPARTMSPMRGRRAKKAAAARGMNGNANGGAALNGTGKGDERSGSETVTLGPLTVPPINVLIVEDNIINLKLLEAFVKRLKVRWQTAMNGRDAVTKWRTGGFHLVLMDIQLPLMSGLDATREIRRLERVNSIGVFASTPSDSIGLGRDPQSDKLANMSLFKSPVIIVALTASSLQSDRNDALAAGCNDFLTKPVNFVWLEKKIMEWGCMQALIDFDGWRKWKEQKSLPAPTAQHPDSGSGDVSGDAHSSTKKSKKSSGHTKRPSMSTVSRDKTESSETTNTVSSTDASSPGPGHSRNSSSVQARSPLSQPSRNDMASGSDQATPGGPHRK